MAANKKIVDPTEHVHLLPVDVPDNYHCNCEYCQKFLGVLQRPADQFEDPNDNARKYSKYDRNKYYSPEDKKHIDRTPLHIARWAIQEYAKAGDWVLDPTMGAGTTAVEAINHGCNVTGIEIEFIDVIQANIAHANQQRIDAGLEPCIGNVVQGDARQAATHLEQFDKKYDLIVNNPPYSGDQNQVFKKGLKKGDNQWAKENKVNLMYDKKFQNLAFLKENPAYYEFIYDIYNSACQYLNPGGHFVIGVKDMMRKKQPYILHKFLCDVFIDIPDMEYVGMALLPHWPTTLFMNTYPKQYPEAGQVPMYQTINVFRKKEVI